LVSSISGIFTLFLIFVFKETKNNDASSKDGHNNLMTFKELLYLPFIPFKMLRETELVLTLMPVLINIPTI